MIKRIVTALMLCLTLTNVNAQTSPKQATVYFTSEITPESLLSIFKALGVTPERNVAVKISTVDNN